MKVLFAITLLLAMASASIAQDSCRAFGQRNPRGMMMSVTGPFYCDDSMHFEVHSTRTMPYNCMGSDTVWCTVCCNYDDSDLHTTIVHYGTNSGTQSFPVSFKATIQASAGMMGSMMQRGHVTMMAYPNPGSERMRIHCDGMNDRYAQMEVIDAKGATVCTIQYVSGGDTYINTAGWARGKYTVILRSNGMMLGQISCMLTQ